MRRRALALSATLHVLLLWTGGPVFLAAWPPQSAWRLARLEINLEWAATSRVLPPVFPTRRQEPGSNPGAEEEEQSPPLRSADFLQPQTIVSHPPAPNHPRQTLLRQDVLEQAGIRLPDIHLPNIVIPPATHPAAEFDLLRMRIPQVPLDLTGPPHSPVPARPRNAAELALENARLENLLPRLTLPHSNRGDSRTLTPEVGLPFGVARSGNLNLTGLIALSGQPVAPPPVLELPATQLRARFVAGPYAGRGSPGGMSDGQPGASGSRGGGPGGPGGGVGDLIVSGIFVKGAGPVPSGPAVVAPGSETRVPDPPRPSPLLPDEEIPLATQEPSSNSVEARAQALLRAVAGEDPSGRPVYTTYAYLANLTSQSSTWLIRFAEREWSNAAGVTKVTANRPDKGVAIRAPQVIRKVDPCYPSVGRRDRIEGRVMLYGVILTDGSVKDARVEEGLQPELDQRVLEAFAGSRFEPARKGGDPIAIEVLVEVPFRLAPCL